MSKSGKHWFHTYFLLVHEAQTGSCLQGSPLADAGWIWWNISCWNTQCPVHSLCSISTSVMEISCTPSQMATEQLTTLIFLLASRGSGDVFGVGGSFSTSEHKWPFQFQHLEVTISSGVQAQNALVTKTLREQGICLLPFAETAPSIRVLLADGLQAQSKAGQNLQRQLQGLKKWKKGKKQSFSKA